MFGDLITEAVAQTLPDVMPLANKLNYEGIILSVIVLMLSIGLVFASLKFTYSVVVKRDEAIKELGNKIGDLNGCIIKMTEVQTIDHSIMMRNRDLIVDIMNNQGRCEMTLKEIHDDINALLTNLEAHAKECLLRVAKGGGSI
jgi:hypothetical protein